MGPAKALSYCLEVDSRTRPDLATTMTVVDIIAPNARKAAMSSADHAAVDWTLSLSRMAVYCAVLEESKSKHTREAAALPEQYASCQYVRDEALRKVEILEKHKKAQSEEIAKLRQEIADLLKMLDAKLPGRMPTTGGAA